MTILSARSGTAASSTQSILRSGSLGPTPGILEFRCDCKYCDFIDFRVSVWSSPLVSLLA
jgi:hypothetical protein